MIGEIVAQRQFEVWLESGHDVSYIVKSLNRKENNQGKRNRQLIQDMMAVRQDRLDDLSVMMRPSLDDNMPKTPEAPKT